MKVTECRSRKLGLGRVVECRQKTRWGRWILPVPEGH